MEVGMIMSEENQSEAQQLSLFSISGNATPFTREPGQIQLSSKASLAEAIGAFDRYMQMRGFTENTQQAFSLDLQLLSEYLGPTTIDEIGAATLNAFLRWMESGRGVPCSPKTLERRITTLKVFFGWLAETLADDEIAALMAVTQEMRQGRDESDPDARPHLLLLLLLNTGIKKSECVNIHLNHLDLADDRQPAVWIRYKNARRRHKERRITLPIAWPTVLNEYLSQYPTQQRLFPWTGRNLEYVLTGVAEAAHVSHVTFEILRWTCALHNYIEGMASDALRRKMGLSEISWYEVENRLDLLARLRAGYSRSDPD
jgi:integrase/recombinase XerD